MASWVCSICGFKHGEYEPICFGCHHPGTSLRQYVDCPKCGHETRPGGEWCDWCQQSLESDDDLEEEFEEEDLELDDDLADDI